MTVLPEVRRRCSLDLYSMSLLPFRWRIIAQCFSWPVLLPLDTLW